MAVWTLSHRVAQVSLPEKAYQLIISIDIWYVLFTGGIKAIRKYICFFAKLIKLERELTHN